MEITRRQSITITAAGTISAAGLSGCSDLLGREPVTVSRQYSSESIIDEDEVNDEIEIGGDEQQYTDYEGMPDQSEVEFEVEVLEGDSINFYIIEETEFEAWEDGDDFDAIEDSIHVDHSMIEGTISLDEGDYRFVIDNAGTEPANA